ncbi:MAG: GH92 family glycosyl hydrolase [Bacteroidota bacterium]|nr:GH92 family glycosyl hydrolase [Bacteroidota bacterium]
MKNNIIAAIVFLGLTTPVFAQRTVDYVNPFIGTGGHGHTYPGAVLPFGMVQLSPDNGTQGWDWCSGYNYSDSMIQGFSHTHLSGTGVGDLCDISVLPMVNIQPSSGIVKSKFSHDQEKASPGYYSVLLKDFNVRAELTTSLRCGFHQYTFPKSDNAIIRFDLGFAINYDSNVESYFKKINDSTFIGYRFSKGWADNSKVYFAVRLSKPIKNLILISDKQSVDATETKGKDVKAQLQFSTVDGEKILMKVGLSFANTEGALESLKEISGWNFNAVKETAANVWNKELSKIKITSHDLAFKQTFYTALYHTYLEPVRFDDALGNYKSAKGNIVKGKNIYTVESLWDTFRAANPLFTLTQTERVPFIINSFLAFYHQSGLLPVWDLHFNETNCMTGYHAVPIIADAILKGIKGFDYADAFAAMKASANQNIRGTNFYRQYGFLPQDKLEESVTITLEYAYDDWCIAQVAKRLNSMDDYKIFMKRSESWKNVYDSTVEFARPKNSDGTWVTSFNSFNQQVDGKNAFTEGNAWQHSWFMPHDVYGLIAKYTSRNDFKNKLDSLFTVEAPASKDLPPDVSGLIGQYAHGNEPSHHIAYLYNYIGLPEKTADLIHQICNTLYTNKTDGLCGNEDCGQMSAWYVFSSLGFYPVNPASGEYVIGVPSADKASLQLSNGKTFTVIAKGLSKSNKYIQSMKLNGAVYNKSFITHADILKGGTIEFVMAEKPGNVWGRKDADLPGKNFK